jgi:hypothetical protein
MELNEVERINKEIFNNRYNDTSVSDNKIEIRKLKFGINQTSLFRVYSRGSWNLHGRWYGGL